MGTKLKFLIMNIGSIFLKTFYTFHILLCVLKCVLYFLRISEVILHFPQNISHCMVIIGYY